MTGTLQRILTARDAWLVAMVSQGTHWLEVNRLWLAYLDLADPARAPKIRRLLMRGETAAAEPAGGLPPDAASRWGGLHKGYQSHDMKLCVIIREALQPGYMVARSKIAHLRDALLSIIRNISMFASCAYLPTVTK